MAETFFYLRTFPDDSYPEIGTSKNGIYYPVDKGFEGKENHQRWSNNYGANVICPPKRNAKKPWPKKLRRWVASIRQIVETVINCLIPFDSIRNVLIAFQAYALELPRRLRYITSASG